MKDSKRYDIPLSEDFEPGSNGKVLKNLLGIKSNEEMNLIEAKEMQRAELNVMELYSASHRFTEKDICKMHSLWLGNIYPFA